MSKPKVLIHRFLVLQFRTIMMSLPEYIDDEEVKNMFAHADKDGNGYISYKEFGMMCKVPDQEVIPTEPPTTTTSNGSSISTAATSVATSVINAVNGALKGAAVSSASTQASNNTAATSAAYSVTPVNTVVTVTTTKS